MRSTQKLLSLVAGLCAVAVAQQEECDIPYITTSSGRLQGFAPHPEVHGYVGIRYAEPPVGDLRFEPPVPYTSNDTDTIVSAYSPYASCFQNRHYTFLADKASGYYESEDCLFLSVWKPANASADANLPVFIWIYGGSHAEGGTGLVDGVDVVRETGDVLFVQMNYRVNVFGFPFNGSSALNAGTRDMRLATEWVRDNIASFGGDPERIVVVGESAGSISAANFAYAYREDPIVAGIISLSGAAEIQPASDGSDWQRVLNGTGCGGEADAIGCLRALPPRDIKRATSPSNLLLLDEEALFYGGRPVPDDEVIFTGEEYIRRGEAGEFAPVPILVANTRNEGDLALMDPYRNPPINTTASERFTLLGFHCPNVFASRIRVDHGVPVYRYVYSGDFPELNPYPGIVRSYHASDALLWLGQEKYQGYEELGEGIREAGVYLKRAFAAFARDPAGGLEAYGWPRYNPDEDTIVNLFPNNTVGIELLNPSEWDAVCEGRTPLDAREIFG